MSDVVIECGSIVLGERHTSALSQLLVFHFIVCYSVIYSLVAVLLSRLLCSSDEVDVAAMKCAGAGPRQDFCDGLGNAHKPQQLWLS